MPDFTITSLTSETFDDVAALVERSKGMFATCWCTWFHPDDREPDSAAGTTGRSRNAVWTRGSLHVRPPQGPGKLRHGANGGTELGYLSRISRSQSHATTPSGAEGAAALAG